MKTLILLLSFVYLLNATTINDSGDCVEDWYFENKKLIYSLSEAPTLYYSVNINSENVIVLTFNDNKFEYDSINLICKRTDFDRNYMYMIAGNLIGFTLFFFSIYLAILISTKRS